MKRKAFATVTEQVLEQLREGILSGRWRERMPGRDRLARELGVNHKTVETALRRLAADGWLVSQGSGQRRRIVLPKGHSQKRELRVRILLYDREDLAMAYNIALLDQLHQAGFTADYALKSLTDLRMDVGRVARFVEKTQADAWIVCAGSREVLKWFAGQDVPAIAMFGRFTGLRIASASPRVAPAMEESLRRLVGLGHRRIVMLVAEERRNPYPALFEQRFLDELKAQGLPTGSYNLPAWDPHPDGLRACLDALFRHTPPTALICGETRFFMAVYQHLARRGLRVPEDVSLITCDPDAVFSWWKPEVSHYHWDYKPVVRRVVRWVGNVAKGRDDHQQAMFDARFVEGGTIGPAASFPVAKGRHRR